MHGVEVIRTPDGANRAIDLIVEQGEGSPADQEDSHYRRFQVVKEEYTAVLVEDPCFEPAYRTAENPVLRRPPEPEGRVFIDAEPAAMILDLANAVYGMLLRFLVQAYAKSGMAEESEKRADVICRDQAYARPGHHSESIGKTARKPRSLWYQRGDDVYHVARGGTFMSGTAERTLIPERLHQLVTGANHAMVAVPEIAKAAAMLTTLAVSFQP